MNLTFLLSNPLINVSVAAWLSAQLIKTLLDALKHKQFDAAVWREPAECQARTPPLPAPYF